MPATIGIFIIPPSWQALEARLRERAQDNASVIAKRMAAAHTEMSHYHEYDYLVVNDDFNKALSDLKSIIQACRLQKNIQTIRYAELLLNLLQ
jgi:guanylate kinase